MSAGIVLNDQERFRKTDNTRIRSEDRDRTVGKRQSSMAEYSNLYDKYFEKQKEGCSKRSQQVLAKISEDIKNISIKN